MGTILEMIDQFTGRDRITALEVFFLPGIIGGLCITDLYHRPSSRSSPKGCSIRNSVSMMSCHLDPMTDHLLPKSMYYTMFGGIGCTIILRTPGKKDLCLLQLPQAEMNEFLSWQNISTFQESADGVYSDIYPLKTNSWE